MFILQKLKHGQDFTSFLSKLSSLYLHETTRFKLTFHLMYGQVCHMNVHAFIEIPVIQYLQSKSTINKDTIIFLSETC